MACHLHEEINFWPNMTQHHAKSFSTRCLKVSLYLAQKSVLEKPLRQSTSPWQAVSYVRLDPPAKQKNRYHGGEGSDE
jgi:hypothetical protein